MSMPMSTCSPLVASQAGASATHRSERYDSWRVRTDLPDRERVVAVDPGGADGAALGLGAAGRVRVEHGALVVGAEHVLDVLEGEQALGATASRQVTGFRACPDVPAAAVSRLLALRRSHPEARRARALTPAVNWSKPNRT